MIPLAPLRSRACLNLSTSSASLPAGAFGPADLAAALGLLLVAYSVEPCEVPKGALALTFPVVRGTAVLVPAALVSPTSPDHAFLAGAYPSSFHVLFIIRAKYLSSSIDMLTLL
jgi:hypothetical protein